MKKLQTGLFFTIAYLLSACSSLNEGSIDYRFAQGQDNSVGGFDARYFNPTGLPSSLSIAKTIQPIKKGQSVSISLKQVFICDFREGFLDSEVFDWMSSEQRCGGGISTRGEILISANVFERDGKMTISFDPASMNKSGRVIFYSDDVRESGQYLNLSHLPIYGPQTYNGNPIYISFTIQELDTEENKRMQAMLNALATIGSGAYPPAAPVLGLLNGMGGALLNSDTDDVEFRYHATFDPEGGHEDVYAPTLLPGDYVIIRKEKRLEPIDWDSLRLNRKTGRLQQCIINTEKALEEKVLKRKINELRSKAKSIETQVKQIKQKTTDLQNKAHEIKTKTYARKTKIEELEGKAKTLDKTATELNILADKLLKEVTSNANIQNSNCTDFIKSTYFTFSINTYQKSFDLDIAQTVSVFLEKNSDFNSKNIDNFVAETKKLGASVKQISSFSNIKGQLNKLSNPTEAAQAQLELSKLICEAIKSEAESNQNTPSQLTHGQIDFILEQLINRFNVSTEKTARKSIQEKCNSDSNNTGNALNSYFNL